MSKIKNPHTDKLTSAIMVAGDSELENQIGVANGFPRINLEKDEMIILEDVANVLGSRVGDEIEVQYDIFQSAVKQLANVKKVLFHFDEFKATLKKDQTQSEALLDYFDMDTS